MDWDKKVMYEVMYEWVYVEKEKLDCLAKR